MTRRLCGPLSWQGGRGSSGFAPSPPPPHWEKKLRSYKNRGETSILFLACSFPLRPVLRGLVFIFWPNSQENSFSPSRNPERQQGPRFCGKAGGLRLSSTSFPDRSGVGLRGRTGSLWGPCLAALYGLMNAFIYSRRICGVPVHARHRPGSGGTVANMGQGPSLVAAGVGEAWAA